MFKALIIVLAFILSATTLLIAHALVKPAAKTPETRLSGRWDLSITLPEGSYETPVEFVVGRGGEVKWFVLGPLGEFRISEATGRLKGRELTLTAQTSLGEIEARAIIEGDRLKGEWRPAGLLAGLFLRGQLNGRRSASLTNGAARVEVFDAVWSRVRGDFYAPDFNGVDWEAARLRYRALAARARTDAEMLSVVREMLGLLRASHLEFFATPGQQRIDPQPVEAETRPDTQADGGITSRRLTPTVGYLKVESFDDVPQSLKRIDSALAELSRLPSLVLDLRGNGGGGVGVALRMADHLLPQPRPLGYFAGRKWLIGRGLRSIEQVSAASLRTFAGQSADEFSRELHREGAIMLKAGGRAPSPYAGRLVVLIDENCFSACEAVAAVFKETRRGTLIGRRTAGAMLGAEFYSIEGGWTLVLPVWDFRTAGGTRIEGAGVEPDIEVREGAPGDPVLSEALKLLGADASATR